MLSNDRFVRVPTDLLQALLKMHFNGAQWRIILWVIRNTYGWNRPSVPVTWYRLAKEVGMSRPAVYRSGQALLARGILVLRDGDLAVNVQSVANQQRHIRALDVAGEQRFPLPTGNALVAAKQLNHCRPATFFRRVKDSKETLKTYKETGMNDDWRHRSTGVRGQKTKVSPGAATPIPGKYDSLSQNR